MCVGDQKAHINTDAPGNHRHDLLLHNPKREVFSFLYQLLGEIRSADDPVKPGHKSTSHNDCAALSPSGQPQNLGASTVLLACRV